MSSARRLPGRMATCHVNRICKYHDDSHPEIGVERVTDTIPESAEVDGEVAFVPPPVSQESAPIGHKDVDWERLFAGLDLEEPRDVALLGGGNEVAKPLSEPSEQALEEKKSGVEDEEYGALWDNVLKVTGSTLPVVDKSTIMAGQIVLFWMEDRDDGKREWWLGRVLDRPAPQNGLSMEVQVYNTHDRNKPLDRARFSLSWRDVRSKRVPPPEEFTSNLKKAKGKGLQPYVVSIDATAVMLTGLQMRPGGRIAEEALRVVGWGNGTPEVTAGSRDGALGHVELTGDSEQASEHRSAGDVPDDYPHMTEEQAELLEEQPQTVEVYRPKPKAPKRRAAARRRRAAK